MKRKLISKVTLTLFLVCIAATCSSAAKNLVVKVDNSGENFNVSVAESSGGETSGAEKVQRIAPETVVANLYKQHDAQKSPFFQTKSRALVDKYFARSTADLIWNDAKNTLNDEMGALGADPLYDAQDTEIKKFKVGKAIIKGNTAAVPVTFLNFGNKQKIDFELVLEKGFWKISDIKYGSDYTLT